MLEEILVLVRDPHAWAALVTLVVMEVVLGIDNLIFISILTNKLPEHQRSNARRIGIGLAVILRLGLLSGVAYIVQLTTPLFSLFGHGFSWRDLILIAGGLFLIYKATSEIHDHVTVDYDTEAAGRAVQATVMGVIGQILILDLVFSLDSIITAVGMTDDIPIMIAAVVIAVGLMLLAADPLAALHQQESDHRHAGAGLPADDRHDADRRRRGREGAQGLHLRRHGVLRPGRGAEHAVSPRGAETPAAAETTALTRRRLALKLAAMKLKDRVAIVTGGASGIGAASARLFAAEGAKLALVDQDEVGLGQVAADIEAAGGSAIIIPADVSSDAEARAGVDRVIEKWGRIDVLLTAAGMSTGGTVDAIEEAAWDRTFAVNVKGTYLWIHYAIKSMIENRSGAIVTIGSQLAQSSPGKNAAYIASKGAIASFTKTMAVDHAAQGIRVNALMPGVIDTPMPARSLKRYADPEAMKAFWKHRHPMGRIGKPEEVARAALFLASDDSSFVTGTLLFIDGGWTAQ